MSNHMRKRATRPKAPIKTLSRPYALAPEPAPEEELAEAELEPALPADAPDVVAALALLAALDDEPVAEDSELV